MNKAYNEPKIEVLTFDGKDVITTSGTPEQGSGSQLPFVPFQ